MSGQATGTANVPAPAVTRQMAAGTAQPVATATSATAATIVAVAPVLPPAPQALPNSEEGQLLQILELDRICGRAEPTENLR